MRLPSSTTLISLGLACLTLSLVLMAYSLGIGDTDMQTLVRARVQTAELVAAQCSPAAAAGDVQTMSAIVRQVAARNQDLMSAGLRDASGKLVYEFGPHARTWDAADRGPDSPANKMRLPIIGKDGDWGGVEFCFSRASAPTSQYIPKYLAALISNPALRMGMFVGCAGFVCYLLYLRRTLRHLDPSSVIPPRVRAMLDALAEGVIVLDAEGRIVLANESFSRSSDIPHTKLQGRRADEIGWTEPRSEQPTTEVPWTSVLASGQPRRGVPMGLRVHHEPPKGEANPSVPADENRVFMINAAPIFGPRGGVRGALATFDDVTEVEQINLQLNRSRDEIQRQNAELRRLATTDPLTGCLNRRSFIEKFESLWLHKDEPDGAVGCVMIDVDKFKSVNDRFGHAAGDRVLIEVARILRASIGERDLLCRYGGEEFCALLPGSDLDATARAAERMRREVESAEWPIVSVAASMGVSCSTQGASEGRELLDQADQALYVSKRTGRNRVTAWGSDLVPGSLPEVQPSLDPATLLPAPVLLKNHSSRDAFQALVTALAHRHVETAIHSKRVADLCMLAAPGLLSPDQSAQLEAAALLHDIGKIGLADAILLKPGPLNADEREHVFHHDQIGVDIVMAAGMPRELVWIMAAHHATFDGTNEETTGRPSGKDIPLAARLLSAADAYDAMTSDRPYRKRMSHAAAAAELRRCAGSQFDPVVVEHLLTAVQRAAATAESLPRQAA